MNAFYSTMHDLIESIEDCYSQRRVTPCLILLYSGIDAVASLDYGGESTRASFVEWVDRYMPGLQCTALDLYAARCGVVHTLSADSGLWRGGVARKVYYSFGEYSPEPLNDAARIMNRSDVTAIHVGELKKKFRLGVAAFLAELRQNPERAAKVEVAASKWFVTMSDDATDAMHAMIRAQSAGENK